MRILKPGKGTIDSVSKIPFSTWSIVVILTFATYVRTLSFSFVYDDAFHILGDPRLDSWKFLPKLFTEHLWSPIFEQTSYYRPIILSWFLVQNKLFGPNAALFHLVSVILHVCATALVHRLAYRILKDPLPAAVTALIFGLHPVHIESVAWISGSVSPLMAVFTLAAYVCYFRWYDADAVDKRSKTLWLAWSLAFYVLAQLTKETAIVFPALIFCTAVLLNGRSTDALTTKLASAVRVAIPYALCAGLYLGVRFLVLGVVFGTSGAISLADLFFTLPGVLVDYGKHLVFPFGLSPVYETPYVVAFSWRSVGVPLALIVLAGSVLAYWGRRSGVVLLAVAWIILPLLPVLNLALLPEPDRFHDRFLYLPSVGFALLIGLALSKLKASGPRAFGASVNRLGLAILICAPLALGTAIQSGHWKDDMHLFLRATAVAPGNNTGRNNLGKELIKIGQLDEAEDHLRTVIARAPEHTNALFNLGRIYFLRGQLEVSENYLLRALESSPGNADVYVALGFVHARMGRPDAAEQDFRNARSLRRNRPGYGNPLGVFLRRQGRLSEALEVFEAELALDPGQDDVRQEIERLRARINAK